LTRTKVLPYFFLFVAVIWQACSTDKNTALRRAYHNTTARYNGYFNAKELMKEEEEGLYNAHKEDYTQTLPIFIYPSDKQSQGMYPNMDKVIEKCSEVIERHSIYKRKKEHIKWIDDCYFLIGKARFYKEEYSLAEQTFLYVYQAFKRNPERYRGLNWLIRTFIQTEQFDRAEEFLELGEDEKNRFPEELWGKFNIIYADYFLKRKKNEEMAIEKLEEAMPLIEDKDDRKRYYFILAQLYENQRNYSLAVDRYSRVIKLRPDYEMRFTAKIHRAVLYDVTSEKGKDIKKELNKMLKDKKNEDFKDQIYYALAEIALKEDDKSLAKSHLRKSVKSSTSNQRQKGLSYLLLGNLYFEEPSYVKAQTHFDSTLQYLPKSHPEYWPTDSKNNSLMDLVENLKLIEREDSLLALAKLSDKEKNKKVKEIIAEIKRKEEQKKQAELKKLREAQNNNSGDLINLSASSGRGEWYFYNTTSLALGQGEFKSLWGDRPLEDDWRRKNKQSNLPGGKAKSTNADGEVADKENPEADSVAQAKKYDPETYLAQIPKDIKEELEAHGRIAEALFHVGTIFKESFTDYKSAIQSFERITTQYDTSEYNLPAHYQLYRIYKINDLTEKAEVEKNWVLDNHPFSEYAYLIKNPDYIKQKKDSREKIESFYEATYKLFSYGLYQDVIESCQKADETFEENHIKDKFDLLKAKSIGHIGSKEEYKKSLESIIKEHPESPIKDRAEQMLAFLNNPSTEEENKEKGENTKPQVDFNYDPSEKHLIILSASKENEASFKSIKNKLADFNKNYFRESDLQITSSALNEKSIYLVRSFKNQELALRYLKALKNNTSLMKLVQSNQAKTYMISNGNFRKLFKSKAENQYLQFYNSKYPA